MKNDIKEVVILENTRPLYTAVEKLHRRFLAEGGDREMEEAERTEAIRACCGAQIKGMLDGKTGENNDPRNHPYYFFVEFLRKESQKEPDVDASVKKTVEDLVCLYDALYQLSLDSLDRVKYPDAFERLCNCMRKTMDSEVCYLLYSQRNHIELLSTSVFPDAMVIGEEPSGGETPVPRQLTLNDFNEIRRWVHRTRAYKRGEGIQELESEERKTSDAAEKPWSIADTIYHPVVKNHNLVVLVIDFPRYPKEIWKDEYLYIIFQRKDRFPNACDAEQEIRENQTDAAQRWIKLIKQLRNVLFARNQILEQCVSKLYILMSSQRSYQYVKRLTRQDEPLRIMHLTDLHISEGTAEQMEQFLELLDQKKTTVDLLAITGDVIQASSAAGTMEERYQQAARFIRQIATRLWSKEKLVRTDWRKRIIIVPGNHDYATMNELQSMSLPGEIRSTGLGYPARKEGGPMVKFAYYIKFLCDLLGADINELVMNDLNEARRYQQMGLTVYALNTVSEIGPLRNNKVSINLDAVQRLIKVRESGNQFNLILSHHGPFYEPNYLMDRYGNWSLGIEEAKQMEWIERFAAALRAFDRSKKTDQDREKCRDMLGGIKTEITQRVMDSKDSYDLLWDVASAARTLEEETGFNERVSLLHHTITRDRKMMQRDKQLLDEAFRKLMWRMGFQMCLSGHTHAYKHHYYIDPFGVPGEKEDEDKTKILCVEGNQMFSGKGIAYGIVEIDTRAPEKRTAVWRGYINGSEKAHDTKHSVF